MATETTLQVTGMDCSHCAQRLERSLQRVEGVIKAEVDPTGTATIRYDEARVPGDQLGDQVRDAGFDLA